MILRRGNHLQEEQNQLAARCLSLIVMAATAIAVDIITLALGCILLKARHALRLLPTAQVLRPQSVTRTQRPPLPVHLRRYSVNAQAPIATKLSHRRLLVRTQVTLL